MRALYGHYARFAMDFDSLRFPSTIEAAEDPVFFIAMEHLSWASTQR